MQNAQLPAWPLLALAAIAAGLWWFENGPTGADPGPPDMVSVFSTNDDRQEAKLHAYAMGTICESLADVIEYDGGLTAPKYKTGVQLEELRTTLRDYRMRGWSFSQKYSSIAETMQEYLDKKIGKNGGKFDSEGRARWVEAYRQIGRSCKYAAEKL